MGHKFSKSMSGSYSMKGTTPSGVAPRKKGSLTTNGNGPPPLSYPTDPPDDENMNEIIDENVELTVVLPDGHQYEKSVEANIPMMDLLINLAASHKLNPASHSLVVLTGDKWKQIDFKANKTIGLLAGQDRTVSVQIVKKKVEDKVRNKSTAQPFEMTYRFTVNLPHNQKQVLRISPKLTLGDVRLMVCTEKGFDPNRYTFLLPGSPTEALDDTTAVGDLKTSEINFFANNTIQAASSKSMPDLAYSVAMSGKENEAATKRTSEGPGYMPSSGEKKAKKGFLSFLGKKDKKTLKFQNENQSVGEVTSRPRKSESFAAPARPKTMHVDSGELEHFNMRRTTGNLRPEYPPNRDFRKSTGSALLPLNEDMSFASHEETISSFETNKLQTSTSSLPKKSKKKRVAPPPPQVSKTSKPQQVQVEIEMNHTQDAKIEDIPDSRVHLKKLHSRNSSDSSGYHELTLSGADSPDNKDDTLQTIGSSHSGDHFNGDSGIRDMSPGPRRSDRRGPQASSSRDSSLDVDITVLGKKKKRAPLPPPGMSANANIVSSEAVKEGKKRVDSQLRKEDEFAALQAMEEVTMKFNMDDSDDESGDMRMVENSSIHSEDFDLDLDMAHRQRPATFVAPPPPSEPPPEDSEPVDINTVANYMDKIDIGVGEDTTSSGPSSAKSSPASIHRRPGSPDSDSGSSVNTLEDLSLAFKQTIAMGEEALGLDSDLDNDSVQEELQKAMPDFKEKISQLAGEESESPETIQRREQATDSDSSFIVHDNDKDNVSDRPGRSAEGNRESSEITYNFTIDAVPLDFQTQDQEEEKEEEEEWEEVVTEEVIEFTHSSRPDNVEFGSPRRIPDLDSPKEHKTMTLPPRELFSNIPIDQSTPKAQAVQREVVREVTVQAETIKEPEVEKAKEPEKPEEFVISLDDLSNMNFSVADPEEIKKKKERNIQQRMNAKSLFEASQSQEESDNEYIDINKVTVVDRHPDPNISDDFEEDTSDVKNKCSELSFSPNSEGEVEHVMEEKSISMIACPAERTPVKKNQTDGFESDDESVPDDKTYASSTRLVLSSHNTSGASRSSSVSDASPRREESFDSQPLLQYQQMQQQFTTWQNQLNQNQKLLANQGGVQSSGVDETSNLQFQQLQLQIQMQQQMLLQLQQSMQAMALQSSLVAQQNQAVTQPLITPQETVQTESSAPNVQIFTKDNEKHRPETPPTAPPPAPAPPPPVSAPPPAPAFTVAASKPKTSKADAKYSKPKQKKFERQLDPREQLMLDIRSKGRGGLKKVSSPRRYSYLSPSKPSRSYVYQSKLHTGTSEDREPILKSHTDTSKEREPILKSCIGTSKNREPILKSRIGTSKDRQPILLPRIGKSKVSEPILLPRIGKSKVSEPILKSHTGSSKDWKPILEPRIGTSKDREPILKLHTGTSKDRKPILKPSPGISKDREPTLQACNDTSEDREPIFV